MQGAPSAANEAPAHAPHTLHGPPLLRGVCGHLRPEGAPPPKLETLLRRVPSRLSTVATTPLWPRALPSLLPPTLYAWSLLVTQELTLPAAPPRPLPWGGLCPSSMPQDTLHSTLLLTGLTGPQTDTRRQEPCALAGDDSQPRPLSGRPRGRPQHQPPHVVPPRTRARRGSPPEPRGPPRHLQWRVAVWRAGHLHRGRTRGPLGPEAGRCQCPVSSGSQPGAEAAALAPRASRTLHPSGLAGRGLPSAPPPREPPRGLSGLEGADPGGGGPCGGMGRKACGSR